MQAGSRSQVWSLIGAGKVITPAYHVLSTPASNWQDGNMRSVILQWREEREKERREETNKETNEESKKTTTTWNERKKEEERARQ